MALAPKYQAIIEELALDPDMIEIARESKFATTQHDYATYASKIDKIGTMFGGGKEGHILAAETLKLAGGNKQGINAAMYSFYGYAEYDLLTGVLA